MKSWKKTKRARRRISCSKKKLFKWNFQVPADTLKKLRKVSQETNTSISNLIGVALRMAIAKGVRVEDLKIEE